MIAGFCVGTGIMYLVLPSSKFDKYVVALSSFVIAVIVI